MRWIGALLLCAALDAATITVCSSGCAYSDFQRALDAAKLGDTIELRAGETFTTASGFILKPKLGSGYLRIRSSKVDQLPAGKRVGKTESDAGLLAKLKSTTSLNLVSTVPSPISVTANANTDVLTATAHGFTNGGRVSIGAFQRSPYVCPGVGNPYTECTSARVDRFIDRSGSHGLTNGTIVYVHAEQLPTPLVADTPYYVVNATADDFQLASRASGAPIDITSAGKGFTIEVPPAPLRRGQTYYVVNATANTFQLSDTAGGRPIDLLTSGVSVSAAKVEAVHHYIFEGIEFQNGPGTSPYAIVELGNPNIHHPDQMPYDMHIDRAYIHGNQGENKPTRCVSVNARDSSISNSTIVECKDQSADSQAIWVNSTTGNLVFENNRLEGAGETVMIGGSVPAYRGLTPANITFRRNYLTKPLEWYRGVKPVYVNATSLRIVQWATNATCDAAANNNPGGRCFMYSTTGNRFEFRDDMTATLAGGFRGSGTVYFFLTAEGHLKASHNLGSGALNCTGELECESVPSLAWPQGSTRLHTWAVASGSFATSGNRQTFVMKNAFEIKHGRDVVLEGNILEHQWSDAQQTLIVLNVQAASNTTEPLNYWARSSDVVIKNNIIRRATSAIQISGRSFLGGRPEAGGLGYGGRIYIRNNLFEDINSVDWAPSATNSAYGKGMTIGAADNVDFGHNTVIDADRFWMFFDARATESTGVRIHDNVIVPRSGQGVFPHIGGDSSPTWSWLVTNNRNAGGAMTRNILANINAVTVNTTAGVNYPADTYLMEPSTRIEDVGFRDFAGRNYSLTPRSTYSAMCGSGCRKAADGRDLGVDMDEVRSATNGVIEGMRSWAATANLRVLPRSLGAVVSYTAPQPAACRFQVYSGWDYSMLAADTDSTRYPGADVDNRPGNVRLGPERYAILGTYESLSPGTTYFYKLWCGNQSATGSFQTAADETRDVDLRIVPPSWLNVTDVSVEHGWTPALGATTPLRRCSNGCSIRIPAANGTLFFRVKYWDGNGHATGTTSAHPLSQ